MEGLVSIRQRTTMILLIIAAGYDHSRIVEWQPKRKDARKKVLLFGFSSH